MVCERLVTSHSLHVFRATSTLKIPALPAAINWTWPSEEKSELSPCAYCEGDCGLFFC